MNKKLGWGVMLLLSAFIFAFSSCSDDEDKVLVKPVVTLEELGSGHDSPDDKIAYIGKDLHVSAEITANELVKSISVSISQKVGTYKVEKQYTDTKYVDVKNTHFHEHIDIPFDAPAGEYTFVLRVTDKQGNSAEVSSTLQLSEYGSIAPEPEVQEFEGVKLVITYIDNKSVDLREPFSTRNDVLQATSANSKVVQNIRYFVSNVALYSNSNLDFVDTGLELHGNHFHTWDPAVRTSIQAGSPTEVYWRVTNAVSFAAATGDIIYTGAEDVLNGTPPRKIAGVSKPHKGIAGSLGGQYFAVTDAVSDNAAPSIIKVVKTDKTVVKEFTGYGKITDRANFRINYADQVVYATDKGLLLLNIGYSTDYELKSGTVPYPASFNGKPFDRLHNARDLARTSVLGIKNNEGVFNVDLAGKKIDKLLPVNNIDQVIFDWEEKFCYILSTDGYLTVYNTNDFSKLATTGLSASKNGSTPRIVATRKFVYVVYPGDSSILRFGATDLVQYKSIAANGRVSDIGLGGNLQEVEINNHGQR